MKLYFKILLLVALPLVLFSCKKEVTPELELSVYNLDIANISGEAVVNVDANTDWSASMSSSWCTISPSSGKGNGSITITASDNFTNADRTATLLVVCKDLRKSVQIKQQLTQLSINKQVLDFAKEASNQSIRVTSNAAWSVTIPQDAGWILTNVNSGTGSADLVVNVQANATGPQRSAALILTYADNKQVTFTVNQERGVNTPPTKPVLSSPVNMAQDVVDTPHFTWSRSTDPDGDAVSYVVSYSKDNISWTSVNSTEPSASPAAKLDYSTQYYWKVAAKDDFGGETVSDVFSFTTGTISGYADGEYKVYQTNSAGLQPSEILILGDGYTAEDFISGGSFDIDANRGIEAFFSVEPYKSYREYFKVYKMAAYSKDRGITQIDKSINKETCFETKFNGGSSMTTNSDKIFEYAKKITGVTDARLRTMLIILIANQDRYAGTCWMWSDGKAIAICPLSSSSNIGANFTDIVHHEAGGHGWAGLADEYITSDNNGKTVPEDDKTSFRSWANLGFYSNVDLTDNLVTIKWKSFVGKDGYSRVAAYQGAFYYSYGAWRAESTSCMINNIPYYSAPAREAAVKKIMRVSGGVYNFDTFVSKDVEKTPSPNAAILTKSFNPLTFIPLAPPVLVK